LALSTYPCAKDGEHGSKIFALPNSESLNAYWLFIIITNILISVEVDSAKPSFAA
jgi:hypothetical protein